MNHYNSELSVQQSEVIAQDLSSCVSASIPSVQVQTDGDKKSHPGWCFKIYSGVLTLGVVFLRNFTGSLRAPRMEFSVSSS